MNQFVSAGDDPYAHLRARVADVASAAFQGSWATVELQPDVFARQRYTVGIAVCDTRGRFDFRLLDDLSVFDCVYRSSEVAGLRSLMESAEHSLAAAQRDGLALGKVAFETDSILLGQLWATSGQSVDEVISRLFADVIPFLPRAEKKEKTFVTIDTAAVRAQVATALKKIARLSYERIVTEGEGLILDHETGVTHHLEFNLVPPGKVGSVISAVYKTEGVVELNYLRAAIDLATFRSIRGTDIQPGIFVMQPAEGSMPAAEFARIDRILEEQSWRLERQGFVVSTHDNAAMLAQDIWAWSGLATEPGFT